MTFASNHRISESALRSSHRDTPHHRECNLQYGQLSSVFRPFVTTPPTCFTVLSRTLANHSYYSCMPVIRAAPTCSVLASWLIGAVAHTFAIQLLYHIRTGFTVSREAREPEIFQRSGYKDRYRIWGIGVQKMGNLQRRTLPRSE